MLNSEGELLERFLKWMTTNDKCRILIHDNLVMEFKEYLENETNNSN